MRKRRMVFNIDRLEVTYKWNTSMAEKFSQQLTTVERGQFTLIKQATTSYQFNYLVMYGETIIGTFFFKTYNPNRPYYYLSVDNQLLYGDLTILHEFEKDMELKFYRISKLDICLDSSVNLVKKFYRLLKDVNVGLVINNKVVKDRTQVISAIIHYSKGSLKNFRKVPSFSIQGNDYEMKGYDKANEIASTSHKEYIRDATGLGKHIYRMEVSFQNFKTLNSHLRTIGMKTDDIYDNLANKELLKDVFSTAIWRIIRIQGGKSILGYIFNDERLYDYPEFNIHKPYLLMGGEKQKNRATNGIFGMDSFFYPIFLANNKSYSYGEICNRENCIGSSM